MGSLDVRKRALGRSIDTLTNVLLASRNFASFL